MVKIRCPEEAKLFRVFFLAKYGESGITGGLKNRKINSLILKKTMKSGPFSAMINPEMSALEECCRKIMRRIRDTLRTAAVLY